jgi:hypothetical protein
MADFASGVKRFINAECTVRVHFPVDWKDNPDVCCYQCKFFSRNNGVCQLTKEVSEYPQKYIGSSCPLIFENFINEKEN